MKTTASKISNKLKEMITTFSGRDLENIIAKVGKLVASYNKISKEKELLIKEGFKNVIIKKDINDKPRLIKAQLI